jgi:UDP-N-acetylmuramoyl-tripeptide--D-alanyl-D-alanine ligase
LSSIQNRTFPDRRHRGSFSSAAIISGQTMAQVTAGEVESSTGGILVSGSRDATIPGISIDSRTLMPGELFFAIRGPNADGHDYVASALARGACGVVVDSRYEPDQVPAGGPIVVRVQDTHQALKDVAAAVRRHWPGSLVGITGSVGKTTTKEFVAHVLESAYGVYHSPGNYNNLFGLPLSLFNLSDDDQIGIFEMGMSARGEIAEMCRIARPDAGVITSVAPVHLEFFDSLEEIAQAKGELSQALEPNGTLVYNADDHLVQAIAERFTGPKISFGLSPKADVRAAEIELAGLKETRFRVSCEEVTRQAMIPLAGTHYVMNALPAVALGRFYRIPMDEIIESLKGLRYAPMRGQIVRFQEGFTLIDDSYNSNPAALRQMTETLGKLRFSKRRILVAGEMLELGKGSPELHYECGTWAAACGIDIIVAVQGHALELARGAADSGVAESRFFHDVGSAREFVERALEPGDIVLVKGSRGVHLEKIVTALRARYQEVAK